MKALYTTDSVTTCDCCGKSGLKQTVGMELNSGEIAHYGTTCAARNSGKTSKIIDSEILAETQRKIREARKEWAACPANHAERARFAARERYAKEHGIRMLGTVAMEFVREATDAADHACREIANRHGLTVWQVRG